MSWDDQLDVQFTITTGDSTTYYPLLSQKNSFSMDMMATSFEFSGIDGSLVKRKSTAGRSLQLIFFFTGEDHLTDSESFIESAKNKKPWTIGHPKYGDLYVQPITISRDDSQLNRTAFEVELRETINQSYPNTATSKSDKITYYADNTNTAALDSFTDAVGDTIETDNVTTITTSISSAYDEISQEIEDEDDATNFTNYYKLALSGIADGDMSAVQDFIQAPVDFALPVATRIGMITTIYENITDVTEFDLKEYFQAAGATMLAAMCLIAINPDDDDYTKRSEITTIIEEINDSFDTFITDIDAIQDENLTTSDSFNVDPDVLVPLDSLVKETIANLNEAIFGSLVENSYIVPAPTNIILLTHYLLGGVTEDTITEMEEANDFTRDEYVNIRKGRVITYYL